MSDSDGLIPVKIYQKALNGNDNGVFALVRKGGNNNVEVRLAEV